MLELRITDKPSTIRKIAQLIEANYESLGGTVEAVDEVEPPQQVKPAPAPQATAPAPTPAEPKPESTPAPAAPAAQEPKAESQPTPAPAPTAEPKPEPAAQEAPAPAPAPAPAAPAPPASTEPKANPAAKKGELTSADQVTEHNWDQVRFPADSKSGAVKAGTRLADLEAAVCASTLKGFEAKYEEIKKQKGGQIPASMQQKWGCVIAALPHAKTALEADGHW